MIPDRILRRISKDEHGCWIWTGSRSSGGYGTCSFGGSSTAAHRVVYEQTFGSIPTGMELDHLCRVRSCCNPDHLEPVTRAENMRRAMAVRTHCPQGHELTDQNVYIKRRRGRDSVRQCLTCHRERSKASMAAIRAAKKLAS